MRIFEAVNSFRRARTELVNHVARIESADVTDRPDTAATLRAETGRYAMRLVDATTGIVDLLDADISPAAWHQFLRSAADQARTPGTKTLPTIGRVVAAIQCAELLSRLSDATSSATSLTTASASASAPPAAAAAASCPVSHHLAGCRQHSTRGRHHAV
jgi:hypothetical protein